MKQLIMMKKIKEYNMYQFLKVHDYVSVKITPILSHDFRPYQLINWFFNKQDTCNASEGLWIDKKNDKIILYDTSDSLDEEYTGDFLNPEKSFEMSNENFIDLLYHWEELRVSRPETILIVIHEDNYVTLETDPVIIKQYQNAGYAFDINKKVQ